MKAGDILGLFVLSTVLILLLKDSKKTSEVIGAGASGLTSVLSTLQGNSPGVQIPRVG